MKKEKDNIEIPFGANCGFEYTIPEGYEAEIKDGKVIVRKSESEDEKIRKELLKDIPEVFPYDKANKFIAWLERQQETGAIDEEYRLGGFTGLLCAWVNQPSINQPAHKYHGRNVVAYHEKNGGFRCCLIDEPTAATFHLPENTLSAGWKDRNSVTWSEKDEQYKKFAIDWLFTFQGRALTQEAKHEVAECIEWLKTLPLRRRWKPSEAMLEALKWAKSEFHPDCPETMEQLQYLYTRLKQIYYEED